MRIGIDATAIGAKPSTGMGVYCLNLVESLLASDSRNEYVIYCCQQVCEPLRRFRERVEFRVSPVNHRKMAEQLWLPIAMRRDGLDVFHGTCGLPRGVPCASVLTVHGLSWRVIPEVFTPMQRMYWIQCSEKRMHAVTRMVAISQWTKDLMIQRFRIPADRIDIVYHGVDRGEFRRIEDAGVIADMKKRNTLPDRYILFLSSVLPVKNVPVLIEAYEQLVNDERFAPLKLVIAGIKGWGYPAAEKAVAERGLGDRVIFTGKFPGDDLATLYSAAELFVLPSQYEGFGIPLIEAFSCGTPVITTTASCLPEVAGEAAVLVEPGHSAPLRDAMADVLSSPARQATMVEAGYARAENFTWQRTAERTLASYERAVL